MGLETLVGSSEVSYVILYTNLTLGNLPNNDNNKVILEKANDKWEKPWVNYLNVLKDSDANICTRIFGKSTNSSRSILDETLYEHSLYMLVLVMITEMLK